MPRFFREVRKGALAAGAILVTSDQMGYTIPNETLHTSSGAMGVAGTSIFGLPSLAQGIPRMIGGTATGVMTFILQNYAGWSQSGAATTAMGMMLSLTYFAEECSENQQQQQQQQPESENPEGPGVGFAM